jgi:hypothetical protein
MLRRIAVAANFLLAAVAVADAMAFTWRDHLTVHASGSIEKGDAARFVALPKFDTLELDSPGGIVGEALRMAANMDARGGIRTVVKPGSSCASACAMALFVSGDTRIVYMGGRIGIHSCAMPDGTQAPECNKTMAANALAHGVPWGVIEGFGNHTNSRVNSVRICAGSHAAVVGPMARTAVDLALVDLSVVGPMARTAADLALVLLLKYLNAGIPKNERHSSGRPSQPHIVVGCWGRLSSPHSSV